MLISNSRASVCTGVGCRYALVLCGASSAVHRAAHQSGEQVGDVENPLGDVADFQAAVHRGLAQLVVGGLFAQALALYRQGQKIGEVKVTGPQQDDNIIADITSGEAEAGDEVREK